MTKLDNATEKESEEARQWAAEWAERRDAMTEFFDKATVTFVTRPLDPDYSRAVRGGQDAFLAGLRDDVLILRPSGEGEANPGLHLTQAEFEKSWPRVVKLFDEIYTEHTQYFFDRWMAREGVS